MIINHFNIFQPMTYQVVVQAKTVRATQWEGLSLFRGLKKRDLQSTDRLTQEKCQLHITSFCSGEKNPLFSSLADLAMSGWLGKTGN